MPRKGWKGTASSPQPSCYSDYPENILHVDVQNILHHPGANQIGRSKDEETGDWSDEFPWPPLCGRYGGENFAS